MTISRYYNDVNGKRRKTREYAAWCGIMARCGIWKVPEKKDRPERYVSRNISVYEGWTGPLGFDRFIEDVGPIPDDTHFYIDRENNDGNYEPGNVKWSTVGESDRNKENSHLITFSGRTMNLQDWANETGIYGSTIRRRLQDGWSIEQALTKGAKNV